MSAPQASAATFYHAGIVTADIEDAVEKYSNMFDLTFAPILTSGGVRFTGAYEAEHDIRGCSRSTDHLGRWAPKDQIAAVRSQVGEVTTIDRPGLDGNNVWFVDPSLFRGVWIEMIDEDTRGEFEAWLASAG